ncbi:MAG: ADP-ribosylglycohydrolase family protein [Clostridia bacterium]|nr:ADP-ribosylglycohydrolase family protein [Clostridia bacterium]
MIPKDVVKLNYDYIRDKVYACWIGKNIGGTIGGPFEGRREILDVPGFTTQKGDPLPNDDLDLQLIWLCAMEEVGPYQLGSNEIGDYWLSYLPAPWNEYGIGKANMRAGIPAPLCGEMNNGYWRHSNGAWIRSEIWACFAPGYPEVARRYAFADACIDHGMGEGTAAEQFTATMESLAFFNDDIRDILNKSLEAIPANSRVARAVKIAMDGYDSGKPWQDVRNELVRDSEDIGWFMAPANVGYVVLGLLYGEGDFKKSMLTAVNCGDDTDCTGATVGAFLGILGGTKGIPEDWADFIGDEIVTVSIDRTFNNIRYLRTVDELTQRVMNMIPSVLTANNLPCVWTSGESVLIDHFPPCPSGVLHDSAYDRDPMNRPQYIIEAYNNHIMRAVVEFDKEPALAVGESVNVTVRFVNKLYIPVNVDVRLILPEGISADKKTTRVYCDHCFRDKGDKAHFTFTAAEEMAPINRIIVEGIVTGRHTPILFEIPIIAK